MEQRQKEKEHGPFRKKAMRLLESGKRSAKRMLMPEEKRMKLDSMLIGVAKHGDNSELMRLIKAGADVAAKDNIYGKTALHYAADKGHTEACNLLIDKGANINAKSILGMTALMIAAHDEKTETCKLLLEKGADLDARNDSGMTALMWAAWCGNIAACMLLIEKGAGLEARDTEGDTAFDNARSKNKKETAAFLGIMESMAKGQRQPFLQNFKECFSQ